MKPRLVHALRVLPQQYAVFYWLHTARMRRVLAASPGTSPHERHCDRFETHAEWITC
jgi:hypothetical protein